MKLPDGATDLTAGHHASLAWIERSKVEMAALRERVKELEHIERASLAWCGTGDCVGGDELASVAPETIRADLIRIGFKRVHVSDTGDFWRHPKDRFGPAIPNSQSDGGYITRVIEAVKDVATVENVSPVVVLARWLPKESP